MIPASHRRATEKLLLALVTALAVYPAAAAAQPAQPRQPAPASLGFVISGRAVDSDGSAIAGIVVRLFPAVDSYRRARIQLGLESALEELATATSDENGRFLVTIPTVGLYVLELASRDLGSGGQVGRRPLLVAEDIELGAVQLARVRRVEVVVRSADGAPVPGARVATAYDWTSVSPVLLPETTDEHGRANVLELDSKGRSSGTEVSVIQPDHAIARRLSRGGHVAVDLQRGTLRRLRVLDAAGRPAAGTMIRAGGAILGTTDAAGRIELRVEEKQLELALLAPDLGAATVRLRGVAARRPAPGAQAASRENAGPELAEERVVTLNTPALVEGKVLDQAEKTPISDALVTNMGHHDILATTDASGRFELRLPIDSERSQATPLEIRKTGYATGAWWPPSPTPERAAATVELGRARFVQGVVVDSQSHPLVDAEITVGEPDSWRSPLGKPAARSDQSGKFGITIPLAGSGVVEVLHPDYATLRRELTAAELESGAVRFVLEPGWLATGSVVDTEARGIAGARVELTEFDATERPPWQRQPVTGHAGTDAEGRFALPHVAPGRYTLRVEREGYAPALVPGIELPPGNGETEVGSVTLGPGLRIEGLVLTSERLPLQDVELVLGGRQVPSRWATSDAEGRFAFADLAAGTELGVRATREGWVEAMRTISVRAEAPPLEIVMEPALVVEGVVVDDGGAEIADATVTASAAVGVAQMIPRAGARVRSALDGSFALDGLPAGTYRLSASASGFEPALLEGIELRAAEEQPVLRVELRRGAVAYGRVLDHEGSPLSGVYVQFRDAASRNPFVSPRELRPAPTDAEGRYRLEGLPTGKVTLETQARERRRQVREVTLEPGENEVDFVLEPAPALRGRVVDQQGTAVSGAQVMVRSDRSGSGHQSDAEGRFETPVEPGSIVVLSASKAGAGASPEVEVEVRDAALPEVVLELRRGATLRGRIDGLDLDALSRTSVSAQPRSGQSGRTNWGGPSGGARPDFEGRFEIADLQPGRWAISANDRTNGRTVEEAIVIEPGVAELPVTLRFEDGATLSGVVTLAGEPVVEARLQARGLDVAVSSSARSDGQGSFRFEDLEHGTYQLVVDAPNRSLPHREQVDVDGDTEIAIELPLLHLAGRVVSKESGAALSGAYVTLAMRERTSGDTRPLRTRGDDRTDAEGAFRFTGLVPGLYAIETSHPDHASRVVEVRVDGEASEDVLVELEAEGGLALRVIGPLGLAAPNVRITLLQPDGTPSLSRSYAAGDDGRIAARDLPAGRHVLLVQSGDAMAELAVEVPGEEQSVQLQRGGFIDLNAPELVEDRGRYPIELTRSAGPTSGWTQNLQPLRNGFVRIGPLPAGAWAIEVQAGSRSFVGTALVEPGRTVAVELR